MDKPPTRNFTEADLLRFRVENFYRDIAMVIFIKYKLRQKKWVEGEIKVTPMVEVGG